MLRLREGAALAVLELIRRHPEGEPWDRDIRPGRSRSREVFPMANCSTTTGESSRNSNPRLCRAPPAAPEMTLPRHPAPLQRSRCVARLQPVPGGNVEWQHSARNERDRLHQNARQARRVSPFSLCGAPNAPRLKWHRGHYSLPSRAATTVVRMIPSSDVIFATASAIANNRTRLVHRDTRQARRSAARDREGAVERRCAQ
jgi:hypothetical protein